jgi:hypothetical protein
MIDTYEKNAKIINAAVSDVSSFGLRAQRRGRRAEPQGYYAFVMLADRGPLAEVPIQIIREALNAEGLPVGGTYGPVYSHMLWSLPKSKYRNQGCPVSDGAATTRSIVFQHPCLGGSEATTKKMAEIITKVASSASELRDVAKSRGLV